MDDLPLPPAYAPDETVISKKGALGSGVTMGWYEAIDPHMAIAVLTHVRDILTACGPLPQTLEWNGRSLLQAPFVGMALPKDWPTVVLVTRQTLAMHSQILNEMHVVVHLDESSISPELLCERVDARLSQANSPAAGFYSGFAFFKKAYLEGDWQVVHAMKTVLRLLWTTSSNT